MDLIQRVISSDRYDIKCPYSMTAKGICIHNTANDATASNEISYMQSNDNSVSFHIAVDDKEAILGLPLDRNAWHAGDGSTGDGNRNYISVEICYSKSGGDRFSQAEKNASNIVAKILKQYGWGVAQIRKHQDFSGKYCPHRTLDMGWQRFLNMIQDELDTLNPPTTELYRVRKTWEDAASQIGAFKDLENAKATCKEGYSVFDSNGNKVYPTSSPIQNPTPITGEYNVKEYPQSGTFTCTEDYIYFRNKPYVGSDNPIIDKYYRGEYVIYDYVVETNKYVWISWISASTGVRRYMPVREINNGIYGNLWGIIV